MSARKVCVVGAGPAGIISVAALVQRNCSVVWVDTAEGFAGTGRLGRFSNVIVFKKTDVIWQIMLCLYFSACNLTMHYLFTVLLSMPS